MYFHSRYVLGRQTYSWFETRAKAKHFEFFSTNYDIIHTNSKPVRGVYDRSHLSNPIRLLKSHSKYIITTFGINWAREKKLSVFLLRFALDKTFIMLIGCRECIYNKLPDRIWAGLMLRLSAINKWPPKKEINVQKTSIINICGYSIYYLCIYLFLLLT